MASFRTLLFVPAARPERFARALAAGADCICLDLEDATAPAQKDAARIDAAAFLQGERDGPPVGVRINAQDSQWAQADLAAIAAHADFIMVPKAASAAQLAPLAALKTPLWPLIESVEGLMRAWEIAAAPQVAGVLFGAFDYAADVGCEMAWEPLLFARSQVAAACARARIEALDSPDGDLRGGEAFVQSTLRAKALGFTGRACIHPAQVAPANAAYTPSDEEIARARRVLEAFDAAGGAAAQLDGRLIEQPVALAARRVLARARA